jgi:hypothetical protein
MQATMERYTTMIEVMESNISGTAEEMRGFFAKTDERLAGEGQ